MIHTRSVLRNTSIVFLLVMTRFTPASGGELEVMGTNCRADRPFPQFAHLWSESAALEEAAGGPPAGEKPQPALGAYAHLFVKNTTPRSIEISDVAVEGLGLTEAIAFSTGPRVSGLRPAGVEFSKLSDEQRQRLLAAGDPVWFQIEPRVVPAGGCAQVTIRFRRRPPADRLRLTLRAGDRAIETALGNDWAGPQFEGICFSPALDEIHAYVHRAGDAHGSIQILMDGLDVSAGAKVHADPAMDLAVAVIRPEQPLDRGSLHVFEARYADGRSAFAGLRAWSGPFRYGMWGYINKGDTPRQRADFYLADMRRHNVNALMQSYGGDVADFLTSAEGESYRRATGLAVMTGGPGGLSDPLYYFLTDEPDAHDYEVTALPAGRRLGALAQPLVARVREFRAADPATPHLLNVNNTYKPENWYMYGQLADVYCADPYYQEQQKIVWNRRPAWAASFIRPTYVLGAATICQSACAPRPLHIILNSVRHDLPGESFRFATPAEKRVEVFYALAGGAKGLSYWWYTPYGEFHGCGSADPAGAALWTEIGLLGALTRTAGPLITRSCPADLPVKASPRMLVRTLLAGADNIVLLVINNGIAGDRQGTVVVPLERAVLGVTPPSWLRPADVFEVSERGIGNLSWKAVEGHIELDLGRLEVARMIVISAHRAWRGDLERTYRENFAPTVAELLAPVK